jgi:hypothetical protein
MVNRFDDCIVVLTKLGHDWDITRVIVILNNRRVINVVILFCNSRSQIF